MLSAARNAVGIPAPLTYHLLQQYRCQSPPCMRSVDLQDLEDIEGFDIGAHLLPWDPNERTPNDNDDGSGEGGQFFCDARP